MKLTMLGTGNTMATSSGEEQINLFLTAGFFESMSGFLVLAVV